MVLRAWGKPLDDPGFEFRLRLKALIFLDSWVGANSIDAAQAAQMMAQMIAKACGIRLSA